MSQVVVDGSLYWKGDSDQPELRFTQSGIAMVSFDVAFYQGKDTKKGYVRVTCFRDLAEHVAESFKQGDDVVVVGKLSHRRWETDNGARTELSVNADIVGASARWGTVASTRPDSGGPSRERGTPYGSKPAAPPEDQLEAPF